MNQNMLSTKNENLKKLFSKTEIWLSDDLPLAAGYAVLSGLSESDLVDQVRVLHIAGYNNEHAFIRINDDRNMILHFILNNANGEIVPQLSDAQCHIICKSHKGEVGIAFTGGDPDLPIPYKIYNPKYPANLDDEI